MTETMGSLSRRLRKVELRMQPCGAHGAYEIHYLEAWPNCEGAQGIQRCVEHSPTCGVLASTTRAPGRQVLIIRGSPWLGLD